MEKELLKSFKDQSWALSEKQSALNKERTELLLSIMKEVGEIEFDVEDDDVCIAIRNQWDLERGGNYHHIASICYLEEGDIGLEDEDEDSFFLENLDEEAKGYLIDCILEKLNNNNE